MIGTNRQGRLEAEAERNRRALLDWRIAMSAYRWMERRGFPVCGRASAIAFLGPRVWAAIEMGRR